MTVSTPADIAASGRMSRGRAAGGQNRVSATPPRAIPNGAAASNSPTVPAPPPYCRASGAINPSAA